MLHRLSGPQGAMACADAQCRTHSCVSSCTATRRDQQWFQCKIWHNAIVYYVLKLKVNNGPAEVSLGARPGLAIDLTLNILLPETRSTRAMPMQYGHAYD